MSFLSFFCCGSASHAPEYSTDTFTACDGSLLLLILF